MLTYVDPVLDKRRKRTLPSTLPPGQRGHRAAETWLAEQGILTGRRARSASEPTLRKITPKWLDHRRALARLRTPSITSATIRNNTSHLDNWILPRLGDVPQSTLDTPRLRRFIRYIAGRRAAVTTRNVFYTLQTLLDDANSEGWLELPVNPCRQRAVVGELPALERKDVVFLPVEAAQAVLDCKDVSVMDRCRTALVLTTALRSSEIQGLIWDHVDTGAGTLRVVQSYSAHGRDGAAREIRPPKSSSGKRVLPLHSCAVDGLEAWRDEWAAYVGRQPRSTDPIFPNSKGEFCMPRVAQLLRDSLEVAGQPTADTQSQPFTFHACRRSVATWLDDLEVPEGTRVRVLGHADKGVTSQHYTARQVKTMRRALDLIPLWWGAEKGPEDASVCSQMDPEMDRGRSTCAA